MSVLAAFLSLPADNIKVKLQKQALHNKLYKGIWDCMLKTIGKEGILRMWVGFPIYFMRGAPHSFILVRTQMFLTKKWKDSQTNSWTRLKIIDSIVMLFILSLLLAKTITFLSNHTKPRTVDKKFRRSLFALAIQCILICLLSFPHHLSPQNISVLPTISSPFHFPHPFPFYFPNRNHLILLRLCNDDELEY